MSRRKSFLQNLKKIQAAARQLFRTKKVSAFFIYGGLFFNLISWTLFIWLVKNEQAIVILHYNAFMGIDAIANFDDGKDYFQIFIAQIEGAFIFLLNLLIAFVLSFQSQTGELGVSEDTSAKMKLGKEESQKKELGEKGCQNDIIFFGIYLVLGGGFLLQLVIFLYTIAIIWVNR